MEAQPHNRFEELGDEDDDFSGVLMRVPRMRGEKYRFTDHDRGLGRRRFYDDDLAYGEAYDLDQEEDPEYEEEMRLQEAMRQEEEALVERALRRMNRARLRGDGDVALSREEIDALERRQLIPRPQPSKSRASTALTKGAGAKSQKKGSGGLRSATAPALKTKASKSTNRNTSIPDMSPDSADSQMLSGYSSAADTPPGAMMPVPLGYFQQTQAGRPSPTKSRNGRASSGPTLRQPAMPDPRDYRPSSSSARMPPGPDMMPRSLSGSSAQAYGTAYAAPPFAYPQPQPPPTRRHAVSYPAGYRTPPDLNATGRVSGGSGLGREVIVLSSDDEPDYDQDDEDESDEGVTLDVSPQAKSSGYRGSGGGQPRISRR